MLSKNDSFDASLRVLEQLYPTPDGVLRRLHVDPLCGSGATWREALLAVPDREGFVQRVIRLACDDYPTRADLPGALDALRAPPDAGEAVRGPRCGPAGRPEVAGHLDADLDHLSGARWRGLQEALLASFRSYAELEQLLRFHFDVSLKEIVGPGPLADVVYALIDWAQARGQVARLVAAALAERPHSPGLAVFAREALTPDCPTVV